MGTPQNAEALADRYQDSHLQLDFQHRLVFLDLQPISLTRKEYELLALLVQNAGEIVPRETLLLQIWNYGPQIRTRTLDVHVRRLRRKLGEHSNRYIETVFGIGYRFQPFRTVRTVEFRPARFAIGA